RPSCTVLFVYDAPPTTQLYPLSLHDALPISAGPVAGAAGGDGGSSPCPRVPPAAEGQPGAAAPGRHNASPRGAGLHGRGGSGRRDRKSTRLNSSHVAISYAVFCLKKKTKKHK